MNPNWWLIAVAFVLGVTLTYVWSVRTVKRQVSLSDALPADGESTGEASRGHHGDDSADEPVDEPAAAVVDDVPATEEIRVEASSEEPTEVSWWEQAFIANRPDPALLRPAVRPKPLFAAVPRSADSETDQPALPDALAAASSISPGAPTRLSGPAGEQIKGNRDSMLYHTVDSPWYGLTKAEKWFTTETEAEAAGFTRWDRRGDRGSKPTKARARSGTRGATNQRQTTPQTTRPPANAVRPSPEAATPSSASTPAVAKRASTKPSVHAAAPAGEIKGNRDSMLYHTVDSPWYGRTKAEVWFDTEAEAVAAGFARWDHKKTRN
jgi:hypothetical protein